MHTPPAIPQIVFNDELDQATEKSLVHSRDFLLENFNAQDWKVHTDETNFQILKRHTPSSSLFVWQGKSTFEGTTDVTDIFKRTFLKIAEDREALKKYDADSLTGYAPIHIYQGEDNQYKRVVYNVYTANNILVSNRDFFYSRDFRWVDLKDGRKAGMVWGGSIPDGDKYCPHQKGSVRGDLIYGWLYIPDTEHNCIHVHYIFHTDPRGHVPAAVSNAVQSRQALIVKLFRDDIKKGLL